MRAPEGQGQTYTYTDAVFADLCAAFQLPAAKQDEVRARLEAAAAVWRHYARDDAPPARPSHARAELKAIADLATKLSGLVSDLSVPARHAVAQAEAAQIARALGAGARGESRYPLLSYPQPDGGDDLLTLGLPDLCGILDGFAEIATQAADALPARRAGRRRDEALRLWMANIEPLWAETLGRAFTRDATDDGVPITEAARFCVAAFRVLDPRTPASRVLNAMKNRIKTKR